MIYRCWGIHKKMSKVNEARERERERVGKRLEAEEEEERNSKLVFVLCISPYLPQKHPCLETS